MKIKVAMGTLQVVATDSSSLHILPLLLFVFSYVLSGSFLLLVPTTQSGCPGSPVPPGWAIHMSSQGGLVCLKAQFQGHGEIPEDELLNKES